METMPMTLPTVHQSHPEVLKRLKRAEGQLRSIGEMIEAGRSCLDIAQQLHAAERAVREAKKTFINDHLDHCLDQVVDAKSPRARASVDEFKTIAKYL
jgi:DNA-binding FrmR family transcriptional regulator